MLSKGDKIMKLYNIYWHDGMSRLPIHVATTDSPEKWLKDNNKQRVRGGEEPEALNDFEIEEVNVEFYEEQRQ